MAIVNGKSLLQRNIEYLQQYGITNVVVNVHHFAGQIIDALKQNNGWGSAITISDETDVVLETGGGIKKAEPLFTADNIVVINVDILTDLDLGKLIAFHQQNNPVSTIAITNRTTSRYFLFDENNTLCGWRNTKTGEEKIVQWGDKTIKYYFRFEGQSHHAGEYQNYLEYFADSITNNTTAYPDLQEGIGTIALLQAMDKSLKTGMPVKVSDILKAHGLL